MDDSDCSPDDYQGYLSRDTLRLLTLAALPLIDGFFLVFLSTDMWQEPWQAIAFGFTALSGAGCFATATRLSGSWVRRLTKVVIVYILVATGAICISLAQPIFESLLPANIHLFTAVFLIGLGLDMSGVGALARIAKVLGYRGIVMAVITASILQGAINGVDLQISPDITALPTICLMVLSGFILSFSGMVLGVFTQNAGNRLPLNLGAGTSLILMGLNVLGFDIPAIWVVAPLACGCLWMVSEIIWESHKSAPARYFARQQDKVR